MKQRKPEAWRIYCWLSWVLFSLCLAYGRLNPLRLAFSWVWLGGDVSKSPGMGGKSRCGRHSSSSGSTPTEMQTPRPPIASLCRAPLWLQPAWAGPCETPFPPPLSSGLGQSQLPDVGLSDLPHVWFFGPLPTTAGPSWPFNYSLFACVHLRTLIRSET